jgi:carbon monoxide dehydrogenase subunit G
MNLSFKIHQPAATIFDYLTDMQKFASVHPVIKKIEHLSENNYLVYERLMFGFIPFSFTYPVAIEQNWGEKKVTIRTTVMRLTKIEMAFELSAVENSAVVHETKTFESPLPIKNIMANVFRKQHTLLFENIEARGFGN